MAFNAIKNTALNVLSREYNDLFGLKYNNDLLRSRFVTAKDLYRKDLYSHYGCVNAIEFSDNGQWLVSGGDDRRILLWDVQKAISGSGQPQTMKGEHNSNIFCLGFDSRCHRLFSAGNDELVMIHDSITGETVDVILHNDAIYGISVNPIDDNTFASACDDGRVCIWDLRREPSRETTVLARYTTAFHGVMYNPFESRLIATANTKEGIALWDVRKPLCVLQQFNSSLLSPQSAMSVRFNKTGNLILALRRRLPPVLYNLKSSYPIVEFDDSGYYNSCTMKSCSFGGDSDQYILSGSDDFKLYMWKIPQQILENGEPNAPESMVWVENADLVLSGHRSIVNQVRYNYTNSLIASSGVEKVIKLWSSFPLPYGSGGLEIKTTYKDNRKVFSHEDYINLVLESGQFVTHDYSHQSVQEDPRMMAFFDSLVQRDIEGWTSDSSDSIDGESSFYELYWNNSHHSDDSHSNSNSSAHNSDNEELVQDLSSRYIHYLDVISKRIESNDLTKDNASNESNTSEFAGTSTSSTTKSSPNSVRDRVVFQKKNSKETGFNRISKLITEKKREQLKKIVKFTVRTTKKKLKRIQKGSKSKTNGVNTESDNKLNEVKIKLDYLAKQVNCDSLNSDSKTQKQPMHRNYRRLRFLTNQSDLVFNEVLPIVSSSSSSDTDDSNVVSGEELYHAISNEMNRMRNILNADTDTSDSSDSCVSLLELNKTTNVGKHKRSSSSDEEKEDKDSKLNESLNTNNSNNEPKEEKQKNSNTRLSFLSNIVTNQYNTDSESEDEANCVRETVIHCPYKHNLCHASTSTQSNDIKKASIFRPIDTRKRSYRKRRRSGSTKDDKTNKDNDNNTNNSNNEKTNHE